MNPAFWRGRRVLVTGHTGFKGAWLSLWLESLGARVTGLALSPPTERNLFHEARVAGGMQSIEADVRDPARVHAIMLSCRPEVVIHLAAQSLVQDSYEWPVETYATNVMGTVHLLEAVRRCEGVRAFVNVTSDKCYRNRGEGPAYREEDPLGGHDPYSSSKACAELVGNAYRLSFFQRGATALASARAGNVIGGGDWARNRLVPDLIAAFSREEPVLIRNPLAIRPWQHVLEPLHGYLLLAERLHESGQAFAEAWNFGPEQDDAVPVKEVAALAAALWGGNARIATQQQASGGHEAAYLTIDASKAKERLAWRPLLRLSDALRLTVTWAQQLGAGAHARTLCLAQIAEFQKLANHR
jgi:CDP-glucose 4,6-dehydratase